MLPKNKQKVLEYLESNKGKWFTGSELREATDIWRSVIYNVLGNLVNEGLVQERARQPVEGNLERTEHAITDEGSRTLASDVKTKIEDLGLNLSLT